MRKLLAQVFFLIILQGLIISAPFITHAVDFLDRKDAQGRSLLGWDTKVPVGLVGRMVHYITLPMGTPLSTIPLKISQKRKEVGLPPDISPDEQNEFLQSFTWETAKAVLIKFPIPGRVIHMNVHQGQRVMARDSVCTIECMKMYMDIVAGSQGEIRDIFFQTGDIVGHESDLMSLLPASPNWEGIDQEKILDNKDFLISLFPWATRTPLTPPQTLPPSREWGDIRQPTILDSGKDYMVFLYPWMAGTPPLPSNAPPPQKGIKSNVFNAFSGSGNNQQALTPPKTLPSSIQNPMMDYSDQSHKISMGNGQTTHERAEKNPFIWQESKVSFQQKNQRDEFKDTSGISITACIQWVCGLVILSKLAFALKLLCCNLLRRVRLKKYSCIVSAFPRTAYLYVSDCNQYMAVKNKAARNRNRRYFVRWKIAS